MIVQITEEPNGNGNIVISADTAGSGLGGQDGTVTGPLLKMVQETDSLHIQVQWMMKQELCLLIIIQCFMLQELSEAMIIIDEARNLLVASLTYICGNLRISVSLQTGQVVSLEQYCC